VRELTEGVSVVVERQKPPPHYLHVLLRNKDRLRVKCLLLVCARAELALTAPRRWPQGRYRPCPFHPSWVMTARSS
jgi:hypothetical protein